MEILLLIIIMYADDIVLFAPSAKCLQRIIDVSYTYGCDNDIIFNSAKSQLVFFDTLKYGHMKDILLGQNALSVTKSYTYLGQIITDNLCDEPDIKAKVGCLYGRSNILLRKFYFCSERVKNRILNGMNYPTREILRCDAASPIKYKGLRVPQPSS